MKNKYSELVGQIIGDVKVVDCQRVKKTSKAGKEYKVTRLWVTGDGANILEIGTQSWNKKSFMKRLRKITSEWIYREIEPTEEDWQNYNEYIMQYFIDSVFNAKESIKLDYEKICQNIRQTLRQSNNVMYHSKEQLFNYWNDYQYDKLNEEIFILDYEVNDDSDMNFIMSARAVAELNEWRTEYEQRLWQFISYEWEYFMERQKWNNKQQHQTGWIKVQWKKARRRRR